MIYRVTYHHKRYMDVLGTDQYPAADEVIRILQTQHGPDSCVVLSVERISDDKDRQTKPNHVKD